MGDRGRRIRIGMVGGGPGAGIAESHRVAMRLDDRYSLQAGVFSRDPERSRAFGQTLHIAPDRLYADFAEMAKAEAQWPDGVEVVAITPSSPGERASSQNRPSSVNRLYATG